MTARRASRHRAGEADAHASIVPAFVLDLEDANGARRSGRAEVRSAAGLAVEADDLDDADLSIQRRWRRDRLGPDQAWLVIGFVDSHVSITDLEVLPDHVIDRAFERTELVVVGVRHIEVHARGSVL